MIKWILRIFLGLFIFGVIVVAALFFLANFSSTKTAFACDGRFTVEGEQSPSTTIYLSLEEFRWWVGLWSDSDGYLLLEIRGRLADAFTDLRDHGTFIQIFDTDNEIAGLLSTLSGTLTINTIYGVFDGQCTAISPERS